RLKAARSRIEALGQHPPEVSEVITAGTRDDDLAVDEKVALYQFRRGEHFRPVHRRPAHAGRFLVAERLDVAGVPLPGPEAVGLDDALKDRVAAYNGFHRAEHSDARRGREVELADGCHGLS